MVRKQLLASFSKILRFGLWLLIGGISGITGAKAQEPDGQGFQVETERFILQWQEVPDTSEIETVKTETAKHFARVAAMLGHQPSEKITILLGGFAERPGGKREYPRVDPMGRILLFKFIPDVHNYFTALAHEMVHVFRFDRRATADWFFEEAFAEFVALRTDPSLAGFPWFDFPVTVVAGQWVETGEDIPLTKLRERHRALNLQCGAQSYALRAAFFDWLGRTFGDDAVVRAAGEAQAGALGDYEKFFGKSFAQLEVAWRSALREEYHAIPDVEALAQKYRRESPIKYQRVCKPGTDF